MNNGNNHIPSYSNPASQSFLTPNYSQNQPSTYSGSYFQSPQTQPAFPPASNPLYPVQPRQPTQNGPSNYGFAPPSEPSIPFNSANYSNGQINSIQQQNNSYPQPGFGNQQNYNQVNNYNQQNQQQNSYPQPGMYNQQNYNQQNSYPQPGMYNQQNYQSNNYNQQNSYPQPNNYNQSNIFQVTPLNQFQQQNNYNQQNQNSLFNFSTPVGPLELHRSDQNLYNQSPLGVTPSTQGVTSSTQPFQIFHAPPAHIQNSTTTNVAGKVISDGVKNNKFTVKNEKTGQEFLCQYDDFLYLLKGDMILGIAEIKSQNGQKVLFFKEKPIVKIGIDEETIQQCFISSQYTSGVKFFPRNAKALFDSIKETECYTYPENQKLQHMDEEISKLASLHASNKKFIGWFDTKGYLITETQACRLLEWWQKHRNLRKLWLLGLTNTEIYNIKMFTKFPMDKIYDMCMKDPYKIFPISMDKCEILIKYYGERVKGTIDGREINLIRMFQGETYTDVDTLCAKILRQIFDKCTSGSYMFTPAKYIHKRYPPFDQIRAHFFEKYPVVLDPPDATRVNGNIYIKYFYDAETTVAAFINKKRKQDPVAKFSTNGNTIEFTSTRITGEQKLAVENALNTPISLIIGPAGSGKCLHPDTEIMMYNQSSKKIKDIKENELIMGPDSEPRTVLSTCNGEDEMWEIKTCNGETFICNTPHVLTLRYTSGGSENSNNINTYKGSDNSYVNTTNNDNINNSIKDFIPTEEIFDIPLDEYLKECANGNQKIINSKLFRACIEYQIQNSVFEPNLVHNTNTLFDFLSFFTCNTDLLTRRKALEVLCYRYAKDTNTGYVRIYLDTKRKIHMYYERILYLLHSMGINAYREDESHIMFPGSYKVETNNIIDMNNTNNSNVTSNNPNTTNANTINPNPISDSIRVKPTLKIFKSDLSFTITPLGKGQYNGFTLDKDGRFLLSNFIVTHNTTIIKELVKNLERQNVAYKIVAPTGKSVARIKKEFEEDKDGEINVSTVTKTEEELRNEMDANILMQAMNGKGIHVKAGKDIRRSNISTIHKLVYGPDFKIDHLIVDEAGMISTLIMYEFILKFGDDFNVTYIGDKNQLSPIDAGNLFRQMINSGSVKVTELTKNHRSVLYNPKGTISQENGIVKNAENIVKHMNMNTESARKTFNYIHMDNFKIFNGDIELVSKLVTAFKNGGATCEQVTIICPYNEPLDALNKECQRIFNGNNKEMRDNKGTVWKLGDRIAFRVNNYDIDLMNREEGVIIDIYEQRRELIENGKKITRDVGMLRAKFQDGKIHEFSCYITDNDKTQDDDKISVAKLEEKAIEEMEKNGGVLSTRFIRHSFAITVHSAQGSEWKYGIFFLPKRNNSASSFLSDRMVYTAITRFSTSCVLISMDSLILFEAAIRKEAWRADGLSDRISEPKQVIYSRNMITGLNDEDFSEYDLEDYDIDDFDYADYED